MKLFTADPVACYPEVLEVMKQQMYSHRSAEYKRLHRETVESLQKFLETLKEIEVTDEKNGISRFTP